MPETIEIKIQTEKRMSAISNLALAIRRVAEALTLVPKVTIKDCHFQGGDPAVNIDATSDEEVEETVIIERKRRK